MLAKRPILIWNISSKLNTAADDVTIKLSNFIITIKNSSHLHFNRPSHHLHPKFRDLFVEKKSPLEIEFGHISETPKGWEERYERQNHKENRHQGKVSAVSSFRIVHSHNSYLHSIISPRRSSRDFSQLKNFQSFSPSHRYFNVLGKGIHTAGGRVGNDNHYIEQHERKHEGLGLFQKKVRLVENHSRSLIKISNLYFSAV